MGKKKSMDAENAKRGRSLEAIISYSIESRFDGARSPSTEQTICINGR